MLKNLLNVVVCKLMKKKKKDNDNFFVKATKENNNINPMYLYLLGVGAIGVMLLFIPVIGMLVDIWYNHTMTINLSDMSIYIGGVATLFISGGIPAALAEYSYSKFNVKPLDDDGKYIKDENHNGIPDDEEEIETCDDDLTEEQNEEE